MFMYQVKVLSRRIGLLMALLLILLSSGSAATASSQAGYMLKQYDDTPQKALFILSPDKSSKQASASSRRYSSVFQQIVSSYWNIDITSIEVDDYKPGLSNQFDVIVLVDEFGEDLPSYLVQDIVMASGKEVLHFGLGGDRLLNLVSSAPINVFQQPPVLDSVVYKDVSLGPGAYSRALLYDYVQPYEAPAGVDISRPIVAYDKQQTARSAAIRVKSSRFREAASGYLFFPFALPRYYDTQSYTNALLDVLHVTFGDVPEYPKQALVRLEDVNGFTYARPGNSLFATYELLMRKRVPFHVALIERYVDPGEGTDTTTKDHRHFNHYLHKMVKSGDAVLVQHGYTHQYKREVSAIGYEFWDIQNDQPAAGDSSGWARQRALEAQLSVQENDLPVPDIWETPHYALGPNADRVFNDMYPLRYESILGIGFLPFPVNIDGTIYIPETLGYIDSEWQSELAAFKERFEQLQVFRNAIPSFFWHPWREVHEVETLVDTIQDQGYEFVHAYDLVDAGPAVAAASTYAGIGPGYSDTTYSTINYGVGGLYVVLLLGGIRYLYDRRQFRSYFKLTRRFRLSLPAVKTVYRQQNKKLPTFAIFVPARNEGLVIANTIASLAAMDYPKSKYQIVIITDERELSDGVDVLTKTEVERQAKILNKRYSSKLVTCIEVPEHYSGVYGDNSRAYEKSTKGRALNYALQEHKPPAAWKGVDFIGVLDADGRFNKDVLKEVAMRTLKEDVQILQGPVYQVSNISKVSIVGVMAGLELARYHLTHMMPRLVHPKKVQFLAGTNYFINRGLLDEVSGWDQHALVEDAELALRAYTAKRVIAQAITLAEIEQTPATFKIYRRQRERWARGHFDILGTILRADLPVRAKFMFIRKIILSQFRFVVDLAIPLIAVVFLVLGYTREVYSWMEIASVVLIVSVLFMWDVYGQTYRRIAGYSDAPRNYFLRLFMSVKLFLFMPLFMFVQAVPRAEALYNYVRRKKVEWIKTERTAEEPIV